MPKTPHLVAEKNPNWKGDKAGILALHVFVKYNNILPKECETCGKSGVRLELAKISETYTRNREDYRILCVPCHNRLDLRTHCKRGHEYTPENTAMKNHKKGPYRQCIECRRIQCRLDYHKDLEKSRAHSRIRKARRKKLLIPPWSRPKQSRKGLDTEDIVKV